MKQRLLLTALTLTFILIAGESYPLWSQVRRSVSAPAPASPTVTYEGLLQQAKLQIGKGQTELAQGSIERAIKLDGTRYEAHIIASIAFRDQKQYPQALQHLRIALSLAPAEARQNILPAITEVRMASLPTAARRKFDALMLVISDADQAATGDSRNRFLREFLVSSTAFLEDYSFVAELWTLRAAAALELDEPELGWIAGQKLEELGVAETDDPTIRRVMAQLQRREWLGNEPKYRWDGYAESPEVRRLAEQGNSEAQLNLGRALSSDEGLPLLRKAADQGSAAAMTFGTSWVNTEFSERLLWIRRAANLGNTTGETRLGSYYSQGYLVGRDPVESLRWLRKAALKEDPEAERLIGLALRRGDGVARNELEGLSWYHRATEHALKQYDANSKAQLAQIFAMSGNPLMLDIPDAVKLALAACEEKSYSNAANVDLLAVAYSLVGDWEKAVATEQKAIDLVRSNDERRLRFFQALLGLYKKKQPWSQEWENQWSKSN